MTNTWDEAVNNIMHGYVETFLFGDVPANISIAKSAIEANENALPEQRWWREVMTAVILDVARGRLLPRYQFCENPRYRATLDAVYSAYSLARTESNAGLIIQASAGIPFANTQAILDRVAEPDVYGNLVKSPEFEAQVRSTKQRDAEIAAMTAKGSFVIRTSNGNIVRYSSDGFEIQYSSSGGTRRGGPGFAGMDDQQVADLYAQWSAQQQMNSMSKEDLRKIVRTGVQNAFVEKYDRDPNSLQPIIPEEVKREHLLDPRDGSPILTKKHLCAVINLGDNIAKKLLCDPQGKSVPHKVKEFERVLNSR